MEFKKEKSKAWPYELQFWRHLILIVWQVQLTLLKTALLD
jgi:hypothetical protein